MRFSAPAHMTSADLTTGPVAVIDGFIDTPDGIGPGDIAGLIANGCQQAPVESIASEPAADVTPAKGKRADTDAAAD